MSHLYLLDTNILSELVKPVPDPKTLNFLKENETSISTCTPVLQEIIFGFESLPDSSKKRLLRAFYNEVVVNLKVFDYDRKAAEFHGKEAARLVKAGKTPAFVDAQIASIASVNNLTLVTKNTKDFKSYKNLKVITPS